MDRAVSVDGDMPGQSSSIAALLNYSTAATPDRPGYVLMVLKVGRDRITDQAERLLAALDKHASEFRYACDH